LGLSRCRSKQITSGIGSFFDHNQDCNFYLIFTAWVLTFSKAREITLKSHHGNEEIKMSIIKRSLRNVMRSPFRSMSMLVILAVSIGLALTMLVVNGASESELNTLSGLVGNEIQVRPAGSFGFFGSGELDEADVDQLLAIEHVESVQKSAQAQYTGGALVTEAPPGAGGPGGGGLTRPIIAMGFDPVVSKITIGGATVDTAEAIVSGRYFDTSEIDSDVMLVGDALAAANSLDVGDTVLIEGATMEIIGIYDSGQRFGDNMMVLPIDTTQRLFELDGVSSAVVIADDVSNVDAIVADIREILDEDTADVVAAQDIYEQINEPILNAINSSQTGMIASFVVAGLVILFSVFLMMRQRIKEIGILKAIGASNWHIGIQFSVETLVISVVGAIVGALLTFPLAQSVANMMVGSSSGTTVGPGGGGRPGGLLGGGSIAGIDVAVAPEVFLYALGIAIALALVASIIPALYISRVRPAEVLRNE
jgi:putative ABC transport system permease protein